MNNKKKLLVFLNTNNPDGHNIDFRDALEKALIQTPYILFEDSPKSPESTFNVTVESILVSHGILFDGVTLLNNISPDSFIQYGIGYATKKRCVFLFIKNNSRKETVQLRNAIVESYLEFDSYSDFSTQFNDKYSTWFKSSTPLCKVTPNKLPVHSFIVFGVDRWNNEDLYEAIWSFSSGTGWTPRVVSDIGSLSKLDSMAIAVSQRSFCIFCLDGTNLEKIYVGIGLAIGMGRPFLIIKHKRATLPTCLNGYHGVVEYDSYSELKSQLGKYTRKFLSNEVFEWEGATYNNLLFRLEKRIGGLSPESLNQFETILITISSVLGDITAKPLALLGEIYREKNRQTSPDDVKLLIKAKECYQKALSIQPNYQLYQNAIDAIDKHIQLIDLIKEKKYRSIPTLIDLIWGDVKSGQYLQVKEYLLMVVDRLVEEKDYVHAISLLAAMQVHDTSNQIRRLIQKVLSLAPEEIINALQDSQKYTIELENEKIKLDNQVKEKNFQLEKNIKNVFILDDKLTSTLEKLEDIQRERDELSSKLGDVQKERNELSIKLKSIFKQLNVAHDKAVRLQSDILGAKELGGRGVIVDLGDGWAVYEALSGEPKVYRNKQEVTVEKGFVLRNGDKLYDDTGAKDSFLGPEAIVIEPDNDLYSTIQNLLNKRNRN